MFDAFLAHILILFLLTLSCLRIFIIRNVKVDTLSILAPAALLLSILQFFAWGIDIQSVLIMVLSVIIFLTNINALMRLCAQLYIDHYSVLFSVITVLELVLTVVLTGATIMMRPVRTEPASFDTVKTQKLLTGSFSAGFKTTGEHLLTPDGIMYTYEPAHKKAAAQKPLPVLLFSSGQYATTIQYEPYFLLLAQKGYTIIAADFYARDMHWYSPAMDSRLFRRAYGLFLTLKSPAEAAAAEKEFDDTARKEYIALARLVRNERGPETVFFVIGDTLSNNTILSIINQFPKNMAGFFQLDSLPEYTTASFGFIEQTDPWLGKLHGVTRDPSLFIPRYAANKTIEQLQKKQTGN